MSKTKTLIFVVICFHCWLVVWLLTFGLFSIYIPFITPLLEKMEPTKCFLTLLVWILFIALVSTLFWSRWSKNDFNFLKVKKPIWIILSYLPVITLTLIVASKPKVFEINGTIYALGMLILNPIQDLLTFGYLQTALNKHLRSHTTAAIITACTFFIGHIIFNLSAGVGAYVFYTAAFLLFALLRDFTNNIYAIICIHLYYALIACLV